MPTVNGAVWNYITSCADSAVKNDANNNTSPAQILNEGHPGGGGVSNLPVSVLHSFNRGVD